MYAKVPWNCEADIKTDVLSSVWNINDFITTFPPIYSYMSYKDMQNLLQTLQTIQSR